MCAENSSYHSVGPSAQSRIGEGAIVGRHLHGRKALIQREFPVIIEDSPKQHGLTIIFRLVSSLLGTITSCLSFMQFPVYSFIITNKSLLFHLPPRSYHLFHSFSTTNEKHSDKLSVKESQRRQKKVREVAHRSSTK